MTRGEQDVEAAKSVGWEFAVRRSEPRRQCDLLGNRSLTTQEAFSQANTEALGSKGNARVGDSGAQKRRGHAHTHTKFSFATC